MTSRVRVAIVGLEFGAEFIPIYQAHPDADLVAICQRSPDRLAETAARWGVPRTYTSYDEMLKDPEIDVVHINTPLHNHADHVVAALRAGKHVGCTIPMATDLEGCRSIVDTARELDRIYMMMETVVYSREYLFVRDLYLGGELGTLQFLRSSHVQDMSGWPDYWEGLPPMYNATHAISPVLCLADDQAESVQALGSGRVFPRMVERYGSPFAVETTHIAFAGGLRGAEVTRSLWATARQYRESFDAFGSKRSFEWSQLEGEEPVVFTGEEPERVVVPDYASRLPVEIQRFTRGGVYSSEAGEQHLSFTQGGGHGGSHPHLAHRLVQAVLGRERAYPDAVRAANITAAGILSHASALNGGEKMWLPEWTLSDDPVIFEVPIDGQSEPAWAEAAPLASVTSSSVAGS